MNATKMYRREGNELVLVGASAPNVYNIYNSNENEVGTWIDDRAIYRTIVSPTELTEVNNIGDTYHYTYRTDVSIPFVYQIVHATVLGIDSGNHVRFCAPCYAFIKDDYVHFSSPNTIITKPGKFKLIIEYTKLNTVNKTYSSGNGHFKLQFYGPVEGSDYESERKVNFSTTISNMPSNTDVELTGVLNGVNNFDFVEDGIQGMVVYLESAMSPTEDEDYLYSCVGSSMTNCSASQYSTWTYVTDDLLEMLSGWELYELDIWNAVNFDGSRLNTPGQEVVYKLNYKSPSTYDGSEAEAYLDGAIDPNPEFYFIIRNVDGAYKFYLHRKVVEEDTELNNDIYPEPVVTPTTGTFFNNKLRIKLINQPGGSGSPINVPVDYTATDITFSQGECEFTDVLDGMSNFGFNTDKIRGIVVEFITSEELDTPVDGHNYEVNYYSCVCSEVQNCSTSSYYVVPGVFEEYANDPDMGVIEKHPLWNSVEYAFRTYSLSNTNDAISFSLNYFKTGYSDDSTLDNYQGGNIIGARYYLTITNIGNGQYKFTLSQAIV